jgi:hypothetical protein
MDTTDLIRIISTISPSTGSAMCKNRIFVDILPTSCRYPSDIRGPGSGRNPEPGHRPPDRMISGLFEVCSSWRTPVVAVPQKACKEQRREIG